MPAHTASDAQYLIDGNDLSVTVSYGGGSTAQGVLIRSHVDALDYDARSLMLTMTNTDAASISIGASVTIDSTSYIVRGREVGDYYTTLQLGTI